MLFMHAARPWECPEPLDWGAYLLRPDTPRHDPQVAAPVDCAIYGLYANDGRLVYVGKTIQLRERIRQHLYASLRGLRGEFAWYGYRTAPEHMLTDFETAHILALKPDQNYSYPSPEWAPHDEMVAALRSLWGVSPTAKRGKKPIPLWRMRCGLSLPVEQ